MRRAGPWRWLVQPPALAAVFVLTTSGAAIGARVGDLVAAAVGAGAGLLTAVLLVAAVDRLTSRPARRTDREDTAEPDSGVRRQERA